MVAIFCQAMQNSNMLLHRTPSNWICHALSNIMFFLTGKDSLNYACILSKSSVVLFDDRRTSSAALPKQYKPLLPWRDLK